MPSTRSPALRAIPPFSTVATKANFGFALTPLDSFVLRYETRESSAWREALAQALEFYHQECLDDAARSKDLREQYLSGLDSSPR